MADPVQTTPPAANAPQPEVTLSTTAPPATPPQADPTPSPTEARPAEAGLGTTLAGEKPVEPATPPVVEAPPAAPLAVTDLTLPEGVKPDDPQLAAFLKDANEAKIPKETSQKLLDQHYAALKQAAEGPLQTYKDMNAKWVAEVQADPEIGGDKLKSVVQPALARLIDQFGGQSFRDALDLTGAGNNPAVVRGLYKMAQALTESTRAAQGGPINPAQPKTGAAAMYPNLVQKG